MRAFGSFISSKRDLHQLLVAGRSLIAASLGMIAFSAPLATAADLDPDAIVLRSRVFDIPFQMDGTSKAKLVRLYVSSNRGKTWRTASEQRVPITGFHFEATDDGEYWFAHATDLKPISDPAAELSAERKIFIDSVGPAINVVGSADLDGKLAGKLKLTDSHEVSTLRVLYATDVVRKWKTVANESIGEEGEFSIRPDEDWRQMSVHITATDSIGNASVQSKTFRRPRMAAVPGPRLASNADQNSGSASEGPSVGDPSNQLRVQTAAGPSDPPSFLLGTTPNFPSTNAVPRSAAPRYSLQSPGSGPVQNTQAPYASPTPAQPAYAGAGQTRRQPTGPANAATNGSVQPENHSQPKTTFGSGFRTPDSTRQSTASQSEMQGPRMLPASGLTAKVTPNGVEVLPAPDPQPDPSTVGPAAAPEMLLTPAPEPEPASPAPYTRAHGGPSTTTPAPTKTEANKPKDPGAPITESIRTFNSGLLLNEATSNAAKPNDLPTNKPPARARSLTEAMRPLAPSSTSRSAPEEIPTPLPSRTTNNTPPEERRYRAERAAELGAMQQQRYDRAQLARSVPFRYNNSNRFSLEYELEAVGASGVESVELYGSTDAGRSWKLWGADPDRASPFDIETKGEGVFSFRIVVLGNNGLRSPRPLPGDDPDIAVIVDQNLPQIKITSARYGEGDRTGSLIIRYECSDENLMNRPVAIAFSDSLDGSWTTIAAGLRNDGLYVWPADPKLPHQIYLRIDAKDQAGNTGTYVLDQPIATRGLAPRARILGFQSR